MGEGLGIFLRDWGPESLLAAGVLMVLFGYLETRWSVNKKMNLLTKMVEEALERERYQRSANEKLQETVYLQAKQLGDLMEQGKTTIALLNAMASAAAANSGRQPPQGRRRAPG